mgnify:CR=1 FL=1|jgi:hypothetical protein
MLEIFFVIVSFFVGRQIGINQASSSLVNLKTKEADLYRDMAEQKAETWERRYNNLLSTTQTSFEE